jgi:putative glutamine amidotransferase
MRRLVALTTTIEPQGGEYRRPRIALYANYVSALERVGLTPVLVTPAHSPEAIEQLVGLCAGLVLPGGEDIDPSRYEEEPAAELGSVNPPRDAAEFRALDAATRRDIPVLGICRGHQLLNVYFGGTLCQDIPTAMDGPISHVQTSPWGSHHHEVTVEPGTKLAVAVGLDHLEINSYHHQAIARVAPPLSVSARADDGLIEAVESREHRWIVGVQWHPERHEAQAPDIDPNVRVFAAFAAAVRADERRYPPNHGSSG